MTKPITLSFEVACDPAHAFDLWATRTSLWWPHSHSRSGDPDLTVTFEPRAGGRIFERTSEGIEYDWGEVVVWDPPNRLEYLWHIYGDRNQATDVTIVFEPRAGGTPRVNRAQWMGSDPASDRAPRTKRRGLVGTVASLPEGSDPGL
jgi:activator of Hsp90 ATPase-like protein